MEVDESGAVPTGTQGRRKVDVVAARGLRLDAVAAALDAQWGQHVSKIGDGARDGTKQPTNDQQQQTTEIEQRQRTNEIEQQQQTNEQCAKKNSGDDRAEVSPESNAAR
jgi:hypothetical protein